MKFSNRVISIDINDKFIDIYFFGIKIKYSGDKKPKVKYELQNKLYENCNTNSFSDLAQNGDIKVPIVKNDKETLDCLLDGNFSMARYGDGEFRIILDRGIRFQKFDPMLKNRLLEILKSKKENIMICLPNIFSNLSNFKDDALDFWREFICQNREEIYKYLNFDNTFYDACVTRPYIDKRNKENAGECFKKIKKLWNNKDIIFVEGEGTRLGLGNDLFNNARSIKRILCPSINAFSEYDKILEYCEKFSSDTLFIIALGPTATVLAYDLANKGFRAIDLGHLDIEYEWFLQKTLEKVPISGKYTNESRKGRFVAPCDDKKYLSQIIKNYTSS